MLAPTHKLVRQLVSFGKALVHRDRLRIQCASRADVASGTKARVSAAKMATRNGIAVQHIRRPLTMSTEG